MLHSLKLTFSPPKIGLPKRKLVFQPSIFRCYVSFREGSFQGCTGYNELAAEFAHILKITCQWLNPAKTICHFWLHTILVGGFNPSEKILVKLGSSSPSRGENKNVWNHHPEYNSESTQKVVDLWILNFAHLSAHWKRTQSLIFRSFPIYLEPLAPRRSPIYQVT